MDDIALLHEYARTGAEPAFAVLVERHLGLVYSAAQRQVRDAHAAEDVTQAVFLVLARKAEQVAHHPGLGGWLLQTTRYAANAHIRAAVRRVKREQEAAMQAQLNDSSPADWSQLAPHLDEAMAALGAKDRAVLALRYFENKSAAEIAEAMRMNEEAARKRTNRALEKLRKIFGKRGIKLSVAAIATGLAANSVSAAPEGLAAKISAVAVAKVAAQISTLTLVKSTISALVWGQYKAAVACGVAVLVVGTAMVVTIPPKPVKPMAATVQTNQVAAIREPLTGMMKFMLETPPGGLAIQPDGKIIVGTTLFGRFVDETSGSLGFYTRGAFRLNPDGSLDRTFRCDVTPPGDAPQMSHVDMLPDGRIFLSGLFGTVDGQPRPNYAVVNADGTRDDSFQPWRGETNQPAPFFLPTLKEPVIWGLTSYQGALMPATWLPDNTVAIVSRAIDATKRTMYPPLTAYRLDAAGNWIKPPTNNILADTFARPSGLVDTLNLTGFWPRRLVDWTNSGPVSPRPPYRYGSELLKTEDNPPVSDLPFDRWTDTPNAGHAAIALRALFEEVPIELCRYAVKLPDGGAILAVRDTPTAGMKASGHLMRFDKDWKPDFSFTNHYDGDIRSCLSFKRLKDGKFLVAGLIGSMNGENFSGLMRLMPDGAVDHLFHCDIANTMEGRVMDYAVQPDGKIVICGFFSQVDGVDVPHLARLNPDGSLDTSFQTAFLTEDKFYQEYRKHRRVAVAKLSKLSGTNQPASTSPAAPESILITLMKMKPDGAHIEFTGTTNHQYVLQAKDSLAGGDWTTISTNQTGADGLGIFRDADAAQHPMRFYRIATP